MREIEFRGVCNVRNIWVYGSLCDTNEGLLIVRDVHHIDGQDYCLECSDIIPETVGQYTGLTDKNGVKIYEGDKVWEHISDFDTELELELYAGAVTYKEGSFCREYITKSGADTLFFLDQERLEVVGNIHEKQGD